MTRVLFVDNEPSLLKALERTFRLKRSPHEVEFAQSGEEAEQMMEKVTFDAIVSDLRMPGMDGAHLLGDVRRMRPETVRIVLSGHLDLAASMTVVPLAHRFIDKPCTLEELQQNIDDAVAWREWVGDTKLRRIVSGIGVLPSLSRSVKRVEGVLNREDASVEEIAEVVSCDVALTAKVFQLVNSSFFGGDRRASTMEQAITMLGLDVLRELMHSDDLVNTFDPADAGGRWLERFVTHSRAASQLAGCLVDDRVHGNEARVAGLLHDIGHLVMAVSQPESLKEVFTIARHTGEPLHEVENKILGTTHAEIGSALLGMWGLPPRIVEAVARHNETMAEDVEHESVITRAVRASETFLEGESREPFEREEEMLIQKVQDAVRRMSNVEVGNE